MIVNLKARPTEFIERSEALVRYYDDIRKFPLLTPEEEAECFNRLKNGSLIEQSKAKKQIINSNQRFVVSVAKKYGKNSNILDLINEGNIGLLEAVEKFDVDKGVKFSTFAVWYIRRAINLYSIKNNSVVTKSNLSKTYHIIAQARNKFYQQELRQPTVDELKEILENDYNVKIKNTLDIVDSKIISIDDESNTDDENPNYGDVMLYKNNTSSPNSYENNSNNDFNKIIVTNLLSKLTEREQQITKLLFGIGCDREYELQEIGEKVNLTTERVRQLKFAILVKLKKEYKNLIKKI